jgi:hypothetical protein
MSVRSAVAGQEGFDDAMEAKISDFEKSDLPERIKVALRLTDAWLMEPGRIPDALRDQVLAHFTPEQVTEMVLSAWKWSQNKMMTSLGMAPAVDGTKKTLFNFDRETGALTMGN